MAEKHPEHFKLELCTILHGVYIVQEIMDLTVINRLPVTENNLL